MHRNSTPIIEHLYKNNFLQFIHCTETSKQKGQEHHIVITLTDKKTTH